MKMNLKPLALTATIGAASLTALAPSAQADLVGHWIAGQTDLTETSGYRPAGTHDGVAVGPNASSLAFSTDVPAGFSGQSLDLAGNVGVSVANSSTADGGTYQNTYDEVIQNQLTIAFWAKGFPGTWEPWVAKRGEFVGWQLRRYAESSVSTFTLRGVDDEDAPGSPINVNDSPPVWHHFAGVWDQASGTRKLYVDGALSHTTANTAGQNMALAAAHSLTLGARANEAGTDYEAYFTGKLYDVRIYNTALTQVEILALFPYPLLTYDFNDGTLQGWRNRVWDLAANGGAGGWIELAPNETTMPATVNGGAIQPPSVDNGLFAVNGGEIFPTGNTDNHLNTLWLRSPAFYLDATANLTLQLRRGVANTADPASEAAVPYASVTNTAGNAPGGWKGAVLRRVSDGAFLLTKPRTGANGDELRTITFTKTELETYDGVACTLDVINSDRGAWGWMSMDNVIIPSTGLVTPADPFASWMSTNYPTILAPNNLPGADPENDGIKNLLEYVLQGGNPSVSTTGTLPTLDASGANFVFTYFRRAAATGTTQTFEYGSTLTGWTPVAIPGGTDITVPGPPSVIVTDQGSGIDKVEITVAKGTATKLFGRLKVVAP